MRRTTANPPGNSLPGKAKPIAGRPWSEKSAAWSGRDGGQFRRKREADVLADQVEIALVRETKLRQTLADLLDEHFRRRSPRGEADATNIVEPRGVDVGSRINQLGLHVEALSEFDKAIGIRAVLGPNDEDEVDVLGDLLDSFLPILRGVADIVARRANDLGKALAEAGHNFLRVVKTKRRLREERKPLRIFDPQRIDRGDRVDYQCAVWRFTRSADDFLVVLVADQDDGALLARELEGLEMNFCDQRASGVNDAERPVLGFLANRGRHTMSAEYEHGAVGNVIDGLNKDGAAAAQLLHNVGIVNDFMVDINGRAVGFKRELDDINGTDDAGTKSTGTDAK